MHPAAKGCLWLVGIVVVLGFVGSIAAAWWLTSEGEDLVNNQLNEARDASVACNTQGDGLMAATVTVTNSSSKQSGYSILVTFETVAREQQLDSQSVLIPSVAPGETVEQEVQSTQAAPGTGLADTFECRVATVDRFSLEED